LIAELGARGYRLARRIVIGVIGGTVVLAGVIMLVTPGPALLVIPLGLTILAVEFAWARHWLQRLKASLSKEQLNGLLNKTRQLGVQDPPPPAGG
jgi:tellurite resistance protein TerC